MVRAEIETVTCYTAASHRTTVLSKMTKKIFVNNNKIKRLNGKLFLKMHYEDSQEFASDNGFYQTCHVTTEVVVYGS